jgi:hypothetical protein
MVPILTKLIINIGNNSDVVSDCQIFYDYLAGFMKNHNDLLKKLMIFHNSGWYYPTRTRDSFSGIVRRLMSLQWLIAAPSDESSKVASIHCSSQWLNEVREAWGALRFLQGKWF